MAKINITTPTGVENLSLISAFKVENNTYVVFDSEKIGSMGLPIIYISKLTDKLEKIIDKNEWESVKNYLKGIINGTNFEYININDSIVSDEAYYTPLTLPSTASLETIKNHYVVKESSQGASTIPTIDAAPEPIAPPVTPNVTVNPQVASPVAPVEETINPIPAVDIAPQVAPATPIPEPIPAVPITPSTPAASNETINSTPVVPPVNIAPASPVVPNMENPVPEPSIETKTPSVIPAINPLPSVAPSTNANSNLENTININFESDKATFLKACENMFDALVSKYEKEFNNLKTREAEIKQKEMEIATKMQNANEHLANAAAREQVANIAHDNAQKIMDIGNLMPTMPTPEGAVNPPQTGVI